jgi:hypothetical protein
VLAFVGLMACVYGQRHDGFDLTTLPAILFRRLAA